MRQPVPGAGLFGAGGLALVGGASWYAVLMRQPWSSIAYGPICGHVAKTGAHCPACFEALALIGLGLALLTASMARSEAVRARPR